MRKELIFMRYEKFRYDRPTQVKFIDFGADGLFYQGGIAYGSEIICGCCGGIFEIVDLWLDWQNCKDEPRYAGIEKPIEEYNEWVDLREEILGDDAYVGYEQNVTDIK